MDSPDAFLYATDSVKFDTIFTAQGSATRIFKIFNNNKQKMRVSNIHLSGGTSSAYQINVNGNSGVDFSNIDIESGDSIYCFVKVNIDPTNSNSPFVVQDSIGIFYNGNSKYVKLQAYGQNAIYLTNSAIVNDTTWKKDLPIVLLKTLTIPENKTLTIEKGSRIFVHGGAGLLINGTLLANGDSAKANRISFTTDRMDYVDNITNNGGGVSYKDLAGSWPGIDFGANSKGNILNYVTIKNAVYGVTDTLNSTVPSTTKLSILGAIVQNNSGYGVLSRLGNMSINNSLIVNNGSSVGLYNGGQYTLNYNTLAGYSNVYVSHNNPVMYLGGSSAFPLVVTITNCILWGDNTSLVNEIGIGNDFVNSNVQVKIDHSLAKYASLPSAITLTNMLQNVDPAFLLTDNNEVQYDFSLSNASPCVGAATPISGITYDISGNKRNMLKPSIGCYEKF